MTLFIAASAGTGWLVGATANHWPTIVRLWHEANEQRYLVLAGETGPVTYLVTHDDAEAMATFVPALDGVLGMELHRFPDVMAVAFLDKDQAAIGEVGSLPFVSNMKKAFVPMICH